MDEATVITLLGQPVAARARQLGRFMRAQRLDRTRRSGVLIGVAQSDAETQAWVATFRKRLDELGWRVGRNLQIDERWSASDPDQIRVFAGELVAMKPDARSSPTSSSLSAA